MEHKTPYAPNNLTELPLAHYMERFRSADLQEIAVRTGILPEENVFTLEVLGEKRKITWPDFQDEGWRDKDKILFLRLLTEGKVWGPARDFVPYRNMPWGDVYDAKFRQRCIDRLTGTFGTAAAAYQKGCEALGGRRLSGSGIGYEITFLPGLALRLILWEGDEEFPASGQILFSDNFPETFSAEDRVVACEYVLSRLTKAAFQG